MGGTVLSFQLTKKENDTLRDLCTVMGLRLRAVEQAQYGETIGALAGLEGEKGVKLPMLPLSEKMLVFADVPDGALEVLLNMLRAMDIAKGSYKAVLTDTNKTWTVAALFAELQAERAALG